MILKGQGGMIAFGVMNRFKSDLAHNLTLGGKKKYSWHFVVCLWFHFIK